MQAVEEPVQMTRCHLEDVGGCVGDARCLTHDLWRALSNHITGFLGNVSLGDVMDNANAKEFAQVAAVKSASQIDEEAPRKVAEGG